ncbi:MAG: ATP-binding protein [Treponema sp.]|nr:ATP-binding protein [Treponema sp.]
MLIEFSVENFRSFKEKQTFSLLASKDKELLDENSFQSGKYNLLKTALIYGANSSGKSNLFMALNFFRNFAIFSGPKSQRGEPIPSTPFMLDADTQNKPTSFELMFILPDNGVRYRYGFSFTSAKITDEYLFAVNKIKEIPLFERNEQDIFFNKTYFSEATNFNPKIVRENASYLSVCAQNNGEITGKIIQYFRRIWITSGINTPPFITMNRLDSGEDLSRITKFLQFADIQVQGLERKKIPVNFDSADPDFANFFKKKFPDAQEDHILYAHNLYKKSEKVGLHYFTDEDESLGTRKLFEYAGIILPVLDNGGILFIDEFDSSLHPLVVENIVKLFNNPIINQKNAQLIISCQSVSLMTNKMFRRDQIWLCEKNDFGASDLYSLMDIDEPVRKDALYNKNYLAGKYGAVPSIDVIRLQMGM